MVAWLEVHIKKYTYIDMSLHSYPTNSHYEFKQKDLIKVICSVHWFIQNTFWFKMHLHDSLQK
jgi:hypothetical protein